MTTRIRFFLFVGTLITAAEPEARIWKSNVGTELEAVLARPGLTEALLRTPDGQTLSVPVDALSTADQELVWR